MVIVSPVLLKKLKTTSLTLMAPFVMISQTRNRNVATATLYPDALETLNKWYEEGQVITFFTSRTEDHRDVTEKWLKENGFKWYGMLPETARRKLSLGG